MFLHLQIGQIQFVAGDTHAALPAALRTTEVVVPYGKLLPAILAAVTERTDLNFQPQGLEISSADDRVEAEAQSLRIDGRQLSDTHNDFSRE
jgi:hypothetical protein